MQILEDTDLEIQWSEQLSWNPDGQQVAFFTRGGDTLYTVNADGTDLTEIPLPGSGETPAWSPDGEWLAFHYEGQLAIIHPDGSDLTVISDNQNGDCAFNPQWSPDSQWIVVSVRKGGFCAEIYPMTHEVMVISRDGATVSAAATVVYEEDSCQDHRVAFSPDGMQVAYVDAECQSWVVNADGSGQSAPLEEFPDLWTARAYPQWEGAVEEAEASLAPETEPRQLVEDEELSGEDAPPEAMVVERCEEFGQEPGFCIYSLHSGDFTRILEDTDLDPDRLAGYSWSPDGQQLAFSGARSEDPLNSIYIVDTDGSELTEIPLPEFPVDPAWSPDGEWLAFHYSGQLAIMRPDGSDLHVLWSSEGGKECAFNPQWSPDGDRIVVTIQINPPECQDLFPMTREVWVISGDGAAITPIVAITQEDASCDEGRFAAFSPDGEQVAYFDGQCQARLINADGSGQAAPRDEFPWGWTSGVYPQGGDLGGE